MNKFQRQQQKFIQNQLNKYWIMRRFNPKTCRMEVMPAKDLKVGDTVVFHGTQAENVGTITTDCGGGFFQVLVEPNYYHSFEFSEYMHHTRLNKM